MSLDKPKRERAKQQHFSSPYSITCSKIPNQSRQPRSVSDLSCLRPPGNWQFRFTVTLRFSANVQVSNWGWHMVARTINNNAKRLPLVSTSSLAPLEDSLISINRTSSTSKPHRSWCLMKQTACLISVSLKTSATSSDGCRLQKIDSISCSRQPYPTAFMNSDTST